MEDLLAKPIKRYQTRVIGMYYHGGIIGLFFPRRMQLQQLIQGQNNQGFRLKKVVAPKIGPFFWLLQITCMFCTLFFYVPQPGETLIFERPEP